MKASAIVVCAMAVWMLGRDAAIGQDKKAIVANENVPELDKLLKLIGQGGIVNNERLYVNSARLYDRTGEGWIKEAEKLRDSAAPALQPPTKGKKKAPPAKTLPKKPPNTGPADDGAEMAEALKHLKPVIDNLQAVLADQKKTKEANAEVAKKLAPKGEELTSVLGEALHGPSDEELEAMVRQRRITEPQAEEYRRLRAKAQGSLIQKVGQQMATNYTNSVLLAGRIRPILDRTEVLRHAVVHDVLRPALRARSGPELAQAPLEVKFSALRTAGRHDKQGYVTIQSRAKQESTRLTVLLEIQTTAGKRFAALYISKLPPGGSGRFEPLTLSGRAISGDPTFAKEAEITKVRYAAWCTEYRAEDQEPKIVSAQEMVNEFRLHAVQPGLVYVSRGGTLPNMSVQEILKARQQPGWKMQPEPDRRFEITFLQRSPTKQGYQVDVNLVDRQATDKRLGEPQRFRAVFQTPPVKLGRIGEVLNPLEPSFGEFPRPEDKTIVLKLRSATQEMEMHLSGSWYTLDREWSTVRGPASGRRFVPAAEIPTADSPEGIARERLASAMKLAMDGKFVEARQAYDRIIAEQPGTPLEAQAKLGLSKLEIMKQAREKAKKLK